VVPNPELISNALAGRVTTLEARVAAVNRPAAALFKSKVEAFLDSFRYSDESEKNFVPLEKVYAQVSPFAAITITYEEHRPQHQG
jgi:hypothetical protein